MDGAETVKSDPVEDFSGVASKAAAYYTHKETHTIYWGKMTTAGVVIWTRGARLFMASTAGALYQTEMKVSVQPLGVYEIAFEGTMELRRDIPLWPDQWDDRKFIKGDVYGTNTVTFNRVIYRDEAIQAKYYHRLSDMYVNDRKANQKFKIAHVIDMKKMQCYKTANCKFT